MVLVDTCGWIEWLTSGALSRRYAPLFRQPQDLLVPTLVQYELYKWVCRERDEPTALEIIGVTEQGSVVPLDTSLALQAADLATAHQLATADAIIYATARQHGADLVTSDSHFRNLPGVTYLSKKTQAT
jgi:predicted nucleic acid-binding protein